MKRLNFLYFGLILLLATSCGNSFLSKFSTKNSVDISITLPLEELKKSASRVVSFRGATDDSNKLTVELYVDDTKKYEKIITDFNKSEETVTFPNVAIGSTVKAIATFIYNKQKYYGESETETVTEKGVSLSLILKKDKQEINTNTPSSLLAEPTEQGVKLTLDNLTQGDFIGIYILGENNVWYERFSFEVTQSKYILLDKYVNTNENITYEFTVYHNGNDVTSDPITVTTTGGIGRPSISAETTPDGIYLTIQTAIPTEQVEIFRLETNGINTETISLYKENATDVLNKSLTDYFVNAGKEYSYSASSFIHNYDAVGVLYNPRSNIVTITADSGLGDITITNVPEATYDNTTMQLTFITPPQVGISGTIDNVSIGIEFLYKILPGSQNIAISYYFGDNSTDISWMATDDNLKGKTLQLIDNDSNEALYCGYAYDRENRISYSIYHYENNVDFSKMPKTIVIPNAINSSANIENDAKCLFYYDDILIGGGEENSYNYSEMLQMITVFGCVESDYTVTTTTQNSSTVAVITLNDSGFDKMLTYLSQPEKPGDPSVPIVAIAAFDNQEVAFLTEDDFEELSRILESNEYTLTNNGKVIRLELSAFKKMMSDGYEVSSALLVIPYLNANETLKIQDSIDEYSFRKLAAALQKVDSSVTITLDLSSADFDTVPESAFSAISALQCVKLPSMVTLIDKNAFSACSNLLQLTLNEGLQIIREGAFNSCGSLTTLEIPSTVTSIGWRLVRECHSLESVTVASGNTKYMSDNGILYEIDGSGNKIAIVIYPPMKTGTQYTIPDTVKTIEASAFEECKLSEITLGSSIDKICFMAFTNTQNLQSIIIPESVTMIEKDAFWHSSIETITFENKQNWYYTEAGIRTNLTEDDLVASNFTGNDTLPNIYRDTN